MRDLVLVSARHEHRSRAMIGVPGENGGGAVELLQEHDANKLMRPGRRAEGNGKACFLPQAGREPVGSADDEYDRRLVLLPPALQAAGESGAAHAFAAGVQDHRDGTIGDDIGDCDRFFEHAPRRVAGAALLDLDDVDGAQAGAATDLDHALAIALRQFALSALLQPADSGDHDAHGSRYAWTTRRLKPLKRPEAIS